MISSIISHLTIQFVYPNAYTGNSEAMLVKDELFLPCGTQPKQCKYIHLKHPIMRLHHQLLVNSHGIWQVVTKLYPYFVMLWINVMITNHYKSLWWMNLHTMYLMPSDKNDFTRFVFKAEPNEWMLCSIIRTMNYTDPKDYFLLLFMMQHKLVYCCYGITCHF